MLRTPHSTIPTITDRSALMTAPVVNGSITHRFPPHSATRSLAHWYKTSGPPRPVPTPPAMSLVVDPSAGWVEAWVAEPAVGIAGSGIVVASPACSPGLPSPSL